MWLLRLKNGEVTGHATPVGIIPTRDELDLDGIDIVAEDLDRLLTIDVARWRKEMEHRRQHLAQFADLPGAIWQAHRRITADLNAWTA